VSTRRAFGIGILAIWGVVAGMHVRREYFRSETLVLAEGARWLAPGTHFYTVELDGRAIGMATSRLDTVADGFLFEDVLRLQVPALGTLHPATLRTRARLGSALQLVEFTFRLESEVGDFDVRGMARGDSALELRLDAGGVEQTSAVPIDRALTLPGTLPLRMAAAGRLEEGGEYATRVFDPSSLGDRPVTVRVTGRDLLAVADSVVRMGPRDTWVIAGYDTIPVWEVEERYGSVEVRSWLDQDGRLVRAESPLGFTLRRVPYELADQRLRREASSPTLARGYGTLIERTAIAGNADLSELEGGPRGLVARLVGVDLDGFDLEGGTQALRGDTLVVRRPAWPRSAPYALPYTGGGAAGDQLAATPLIQIRDPRILERARQIADGSTDPVVVARRLSDWVHGVLEKDITLSIPSAVQVLEAGRGDCNEHTVLFVALARALGLPARTAVGLVHVRGAFYYHAWPEVWLGAWVPVDPTLGQVPADASHLRFLVGGPDRQVELVRLIGRLDIDILNSF